MTTQYRITAALRVIPDHLTAGEIAQIIGASPRDVIEALHDMQDNGTILMRNGLYWLSEAARAMSGTSYGVTFQQHIAKAEGRSND